MAENEVENKFNRKFGSQNSGKKRKTGFSEPRLKYLIVCEGEKTEPLYFEDIQGQLPPEIITLDIMGTGDNTLNIIARAKEAREKAKMKAKRNPGYKEYDEIWTVFDKDDFPSQNFNNAIFKAKEENIYAAYSNEAFELWYLLHFNFYNTAMNRDDYKKKLSECLSRKYEKNNSEIVLLINTDINRKRAIQNAKRLYEQSGYDHKNPANENPSTTVYQLVEKLYKQIPKEKLTP